MPQQWHILRRRRTPRLPVLLSGAASSAVATIIGG
jgi:hypothetical protein